MAEATEMKLEIWPLDRKLQKLDLIELRTQLRQRPKGELHEGFPVPTELERVEQLEEMLELGPPEKAARAIENIRRELNQKGIWCDHRASVAVVRIWN
jgi:hypothetical protein